jgi:hypothetical protein
MARRKDIAGLAALGALGMMLNRQGESKGPSPVYDLDTRASTETASPDISTMGRDENYGNEGRRTGPVGIGNPPSRPAGNRVTKPVSPSANRLASQASPSATSNASTRSDPDAPDSVSRQQQYEAAQAQANTPQGRAERQTRAESQALKAVRPEELLVGGGSFAGLKTVANMAKNLANRRGAEKAAEYTQPAIGYAERKLLESGSKRPLLDGPPKRLTGPASKEVEDVVDKSRDAVTNPMAWMAGPKGMKENFKRGGQVKKMASSGTKKVSASSRGDGIAMRGKTRGIMR